ncbi:MAG: TIM barrel protein [Bacillota bacterium]|nr:TIM barrel protein [Bacillota bacterium]
MNKNNLFISTIADDAAALASKHELGLEIAEFCTAVNMDDNFRQIEPAVHSALDATSRFVFHAPFNELYPAAIDPLAVKLAHDRLDQAVRLSLSYDVQRIVMHSGNLPQLYCKSWFEERSIVFWREFLHDKPPDIRIYVENVFDNDPKLLLRVIEAVNDPRLSLCLDIGHANCQANLSPLEWLKTNARQIAHFHIHNNSGEDDTHNNLKDGTIDIKEFLTAAAVLCPNATYTIETMHAEPSLLWLIENGFV